MEKETANHASILLAVGIPYKNAQFTINDKSHKSLTTTKKKTKSKNSFFFEFVKLFILDV